MILWLIIGIGGFIGAVLRYLISGWVQNKVVGVSFPLGTFTVNLIGCFFISLTMYLSEYWGLFNRETRILFTIGILGSFTTVSTFSYEAFKMLEHGDIPSAVVYIVGTVGICLFAVFLGKVLALSLWRV